MLCTQGFMTQFWLGFRDDAACDRFMPRSEALRKTIASDTLKSCLGSAKYTEHRVPASLASEPVKELTIAKGDRKIISNVLAPKTTLTQPNAVYAPSITIGMGIQNGVPAGRITQAILRGATVDPQTGAWTEAAGQGTLSGISFAFDAQGNVTGLPADLAADDTLGPAIATAWSDIVVVLGKINTIRKAL